MIDIKAVHPARADPVAPLAAMATKPSAHGAATNALSASAKREINPFVRKPVTTGGLLTSRRADLSGTVRSVPMREASRHFAHAKRVAARLATSLPDLLQNPLKDPNSLTAKVTIPFVLPNAPLAQGRNRNGKTARIVLRESASPR